MIKARQFWLAQRYDDRYEGFELPCGDYSNWKGAIKVIEHSAFVRLQDELEYTKRLLADERSGDCDKDKTIRRLERNLNNALSENAVLREALEFYASGDYWGYEHPSSDIFNSIDSRDLGIGDFQLSEDADDDGVGGRTAREALEKVK